MNVYTAIFMKMIIYYINTLFRQYMTMTYETARHSAQEWKADENGLGSAFAFMTQIKEACVKSLDLHFSSLNIPGNTVERAWPRVILIIL